jgi:hypothetical protein
MFAARPAVEPLGYLAVLLRSGPTVLTVVGLALPGFDKLLALHSLPA